MSEVREVQITDYFDQALPLMRENWAETGFGFEFNPSRERYERLQASGLLFALGAFDGEELVGYSTAVVVEHLFNPARFTCSTDALFVRKSHRNGTLPGRLILETERIARERGAHSIAWHTRAGTKFSQALLLHGYELADVVVTKDL